MYHEEYFMSLDELDILPEEEFEICEKAAESGNMTAMLKLAEFYEKGIGTDINKEMATYWRKQAGIKNA